MIYIDSDGFEYYEEKKQCPICHSTKFHTKWDNSNMAGRVDELQEYCVHCGYRLKMDTDMGYYMEGFDPDIVKGFASLRPNTYVNKNIRRRKRLRRKLGIKRCQIDTAFRSNNATKFEHIHLNSDK